MNEEDKKEIDAMDHEQIGRLLRFGEEHKFFFDPYYDYLMDRFKSLGGWTPELSKRLGWEK